MFTQPTGKPIDPRADYQEWRDLLSAAEVRAAQLHDARHTTATMLLVLRTPVRGRHGAHGLDNGIYGQPVHARA
ncbi:hypothetical protein JOF56_001799 [Kibdelosporangium banguiense]|uniref:Phage integrase family protein n=1 Tax=Kibdelosporangium banguiense TaxID=1365924 RepID=A0ABS4TBQ3_9PSEU|nr:hypothetical protein [Kibdelosporangium banguiense]MBP2321414.1 hypothetical protein [Kibdelosporangium banguiense]